MITQWCTSKNHAVMTVKEKNTMVHVQKHSIIKVHFQKNCIIMVKIQKTWQYQCKSPIKHGIIKVHFQKTWYYYGENAKNMKIQKMALSWYKCKHDGIIMVNMVNIVIPWYMSKNHVTTVNVKNTTIQSKTGNYHNTYPKVIA